MVTHLSHQLRVSKKKNENLAERLHRAESSVDMEYTNILNDMISSVRNFILCHFRNNYINNFKRQYTLEDKVFALSLYKRSPSSYRYMAKIFCLPSAETLRQLAKTLAIKPGLCASVFESLKTQAEKRPPDDRYCMLLMDDVDIDRTILLNEAKDIVEGFVDDGSRRKCEIADHASVWMLKGVPKNSSEKPWKQAIAFSCCKSCMATPDIICTYKEIVRRVLSSGLQTIASVCDQGRTNESAMKYLIKETRAANLRNGESNINDTIIIDNNEIVHLFDPPHLLKCMRNNLLTKNLKFVYDKKIRTASWKYIVTAYEIDKSHGVFKVLKNISKSHVYPVNIKKMRVKYCAQILSHTMASTLVQMSHNQVKSKCGKFEMRIEGEDTGYLCLFLDELFDSVNGNGSKKKNEEESVYKTPITTEGDCPHVQLLNDAIKVFESIKFIKVNNRDHERFIL